MQCSNEALLKRYLEAVAVWLPAAQRDDIAAELADNLRSRIDEQETGLGRRLKEDELVEILKERGHPLAVAGSYSTHRCLIGPGLFPMYRFVAVLVILWIQLPLFAIVIGPLSAFASPHPIAAVLHTTATYLMAAVTAFTVITLVFASFERYGVRVARNWNPRHLSCFTIPKAILDADPAVWACGVSQSVFSMVFALGWQYLVQHWNSFHFGLLGSRLDPILQATYWPIMISLLAGIAQGVSAVLFPGRRDVSGVFRLANAGVSLTVLAILFEMRAVETLAAPFLPPGALNGTHSDWIHLGLQLPIVLVAVAILADAAKVILILKNSRTKHDWRLHPVPGK